MTIHSHALLLTGLSNPNMEYCADKRFVLMCDCAAFEMLVYVLMNTPCICLGRTLSLARRRIHVCTALRRILASLNPQATDRTCLQKVSQLDIDEGKYETHVFCCHSRKAFHRIPSACLPRRTFIATLNCTCRFHDSKVFSISNESVCFIS